MAARKHIHGHQGKDVHHRSPTVLLVIDMINALDFPEADQLLRQALPCAKAIRALKRRCKANGVPTIYVNNNFGQWRSDWKKIFSACADPACKGSKLAGLLEPEEDDYFVLKPKNSAFQETPLATLLRQLGARRLIVTGVATNICVFFTIHDAYALGSYEIVVPRDCVAANTARHTNEALREIHEIFGIRAVQSGSIRP